MTFLTPVAALAALAALVPLGAALAGRRRVADVRRTLGLAAPAHPGIGRLAALTAALALLGLAAAQPALTHESAIRVRTHVAALFVLDTSRSMAASSTRTSPTRLDRAVAAAVRLRSAIADVPSGVATLTDRVLPDLLPVPDVAGFDAVAERTVAIESPPPRNTGVRATTYSALEGIAAGDFFDPLATRRIVVLLTDGETNPIDPGEVAHALSQSQGYRFVAIRFWRSDESVYGANGKPEPGYRPDPAGRAVLTGLASAASGRAFEEHDLGAATSYLQDVVGSGASSVSHGLSHRRQPLGPEFAAVALVLLLGAICDFSRLPTKAKITTRWLLGTPRHERSA